MSNKVAPTKEEPDPRVKCGKYKDAAKHAKYVDAAVLEAIDVTCKTKREAAKGEVTSTKGKGASKKGAHTKCARDQMPAVVSAVCHAELSDQSPEVVAVVKRCDELCPEGGGVYPTKVVAQAVRECETSSLQCHRLLKREDWLFRGET